MSSQKEQLNSIGFLWEDVKQKKQDKEWEEMYQKLKTYKERRE
jgi:hypothetical protein